VTAVTQLQLWVEAGAAMVAMAGRNTTGSGGRGADCRRNDRRCKGTLRAGGKRAKTKRYGIRRGRSKTLRMGRVPGRRVRLLTKEEGTFGPKIVSRRVRVKQVR
jgi:hypothetical protein